MADAPNDAEAARRNGIRRPPAPAVPGYALPRLGVEDEGTPIERSQPERPEQDNPAEPSPNGSVDSLVGRAVAPVARAGWNGVRGVGRVLGINRVVDRGVDRALESKTAADATEKLLKTDTANRVWDKVLESEEAQKLVERVADAPEVRAAITSQGIGLLEDLRRGVRSASRRIDTVVENGARRVLRRPPRDRRPIFAGAFSRALALAIDAGVVYGSLLVISAAIAALVNAFSKGDQHADTVVVAIGAAIWAWVAALYLLILWSGAGRTVGMSFVAIRMLSEDGEPVRPGQAIRRLVWTLLAALPFFLGYWGVLFEGERRGWPDRRARTVVCYSDPELDKDIV